MKATLIALAISVLITLAGAFVYSGYMGKMAKDKNVDPNVKLADVKSGKVKPPAEYAGGVAE